MKDDSYVPVFNWPIAELTLSERTKSLAPLWRHIAPLVQPGMRVLDLCCGSGAAAFLLEELGAAVTAIDSSPLLSEQARAEAARRGSTVEIIRADVLGYKFDAGAADLAILLGNPLLDFPPERFGPFRANLAAALKSGGRLVMEYYDGVMIYSRWSDPVEKVSDTEPEVLVRRFLAYDPSRGVCEFEVHNRTRDEHALAQCYIYTMPLVRLLLEPYFALEQSHNLGEGKFLDVWMKK